MECRKRKPERETAGEVSTFPLNLAGWAWRVDGKGWARDPDGNAYADCCRRSDRSRPKAGRTDSLRQVADRPAHRHRLHGRGLLRDAPEREEVRDQDALPAH